MPLNCTTAISTSAVFLLPALQTLINTKTSAAVTNMGRISGVAGHKPDMVTTLGTNSVVNKMSLDIRRHFITKEALPINIAPRLNQTVALAANSSSKINTGQIKLQGPPFQSKVPPTILTFTTSGNVPLLPKQFSLAELVSKKPTSIPKKRQLKKYHAKPTISAETGHKQLKREIERLEPGKKKVGCPRKIIKHVKVVERSQRLILPKPNNGCVASEKQNSPVSMPPTGSQAVASVLNVPWPDTLYLPSSSHHSRPRPSDPVEFATSHQEMKVTPGVADGSSLHYTPMTLNSKDCLNLLSIRTPTFSSITATNDVHIRHHGGAILSSCKHDDGSKLHAETLDEQCKIHEFNSSNVTPTAVGTTTYTSSISSNTGSSSTNSGSTSINAGSSTTHAVTTNVVATTSSHVPSLVSNVITATTTTTFAVTTSAVTTSAVTTSATASSVPSFVTVPSRQLSFVIKTGIPNSNGTVRDQKDHAPVIRIKTTTGCLPSSGSSSKTKDRSLHTDGSDRNSMVSVSFNNDSTVLSDTSCLNNMTCTNDSINNNNNNIFSSLEQVNLHNKQNTVNTRKLLATTCGIEQDEPLDENILKNIRNVQHNQVQNYNSNVSSLSRDSSGIKAYHKLVRSFKQHPKHASVQTRSHPQQEGDGESSRRTPATSSQLGGEQHGSQQHHVCVTAEELPHSASRRTTPNTNEQARTFDHRKVSPVHCDVSNITTAVLDTTHPFQLLDAPHSGITVLHSEGQSSHPHSFSSSTFIVETSGYNGESTDHHQASPLNSHDASSPHHSPPQIDCNAITDQLIIEQQPQQLSGLAAQQQELCLAVLAATDGDRAPLPQHVNRDTRTMLCDVCGKLLKGASNLRSHLLVHQSVRPHVCPHCGRGFRRSTNLNHHLRTHSKEAPYACHLCSRTFKTTSNLKRHLTVHSQNSDQHVCSQCGKLFKTKQGLNSHSKAHSEVKLCPCPECGETFNSLNSLKIHKLRHKYPERQFECKLCSKSYAYQSLLSRHMDGHRGVLSHKCHLCSAEFVWKSGLTSHLKTHLPKKFKCRICAVSFNTEIKFRSHTKKHSNPRPHNCSLCFKKFPYNYLLVRHVRSAHGHKAFVAVKGKKPLAKRRKRCRPSGNSSSILANEDPSSLCDANNEGFTDEVADVHTISSSSATARLNTQHRTTGPATAYRFRCVSACGESVPGNTGRLVHGVSKARTNGNTGEPSVRRGPPVKATLTDIVSTSAWTAPSTSAAVECRVSADTGSSSNLFLNANLPVGVEISIPASASEACGVAVAREPPPSYSSSPRSHTTQLSLNSYLSSDQQQTHKPTQTQQSILEHRAAVATFIPSYDHFQSPRNVQPSPAYNGGGGCASLYLLGHHPNLLHATNDPYLQSSTCFSSPHQTGFSPQQQPSLSCFQEYDDPLSAGLGDHDEAAIIAAAAAGHASSEALVGYNIDSESTPQPHLTPLYPTLQHHHLREELVASEQPSSPQLSHLQHPLETEEYQSI